MRNSVIAPVCQREPLLSMVGCGELRRLLADLYGSPIGALRKMSPTFFYTHILDIGGRRAESDFMKLHAAVQQVATGSRRPQLAASRNVCGGFRLPRIA